VRRLRKRLRLRWVRLRAAASVARLPWMEEWAARLRNRAASVARPRNRAASAVRLRNKAVTVRLRVPVRARVSIRISNNNNSSKLR